MMLHRVRISAALSIGLLLAGCGGAGGGGGDSTTGVGPQDTTPVGLAPTEADKRVATYATTGTDGAWGQVDLVDDGNPDPDTQGPADVQKQAFFNKLITMNGTDFTGDGLLDKYAT